MLALGNPGESPVWNEAGNPLWLKMATSPSSDVDVNKCAITLYAELKPNLSAMQIVLQFKADRYAIPLQHSHDSNLVKIVSLAQSVRRSGPVVRSDQNLVLFIKNIFIIFLEVVTRRSNVLLVLGI